jgi:hypothetical protein
MADHFFQNQSPITPLQAPASHNVDRELSPSDLAKARGVLALLLLGLVLYVVGAVGRWMLGSSAKDTFKTKFKTAIEAAKTLAPCATESANVDPAGPVSKLEDLFVRLDKIDRNQSRILAHLDTIDRTVFDASMAVDRRAVASA